jgi:TM2 domain-containing membrane protein YozV
MALVSCPECKAEVSDRAANCPRCGYPIAAQQAQATAAKPLHPDYVSPREATGSAGAQSLQVIKQAKSRGIYVILGLFFGLLGVHNFYAGYFGRGVAQLLIVAVTGWFVVGLVVVAIWVIIELFVVTQDAAGDAFV